MAYYYEEPSHTFNEYLLIPRYTGIEHNPQNINLHTPLTLQGKNRCIRSIFR